MAIVLEFQLSGLLRHSANAVCLYQQKGDSID